MSLQFIALYYITDCWLQPITCLSISGVAGLAAAVIHCGFI